MERCLGYVRDWCSKLIRPHQVPCMYHYHPKSLGPVSISEKTSFRKISWSLEVARFVFRIVRSLWNLTGTSAALLPMCLSKFKAIRQFKVPISWLRDFTRSYDKMSFLILRRGPGRVIFVTSSGIILKLDFSKLNEVNFIIAIDKCISIYRNVMSSLVRNNPNPNNTSESPYGR